MMSRYIALGLLLAVSSGLAFNSHPLHRRAFATPKSVYRSPLFHHPKQRHSRSSSSHEDSTSNVSKLRKVLNRLDTVASAGLEDVKLAGIFKRIKDIHNPITYMVLALLAGIRWDWCFRNPYYWFAVGFCVKWYRARYVFKIPVWDRQPNWNNIITSREQEKDLKAFTCKQCGSTLFIAKTREFFFEGDTGIGGLGCFTCGAKGKENFVMDRDRIVEDVADMDDYFEYERPLDFVSRAERRKLMKEAGGDEEKANQLLAERAAAEEAENAGDDTTEGADVSKASTAEDGSETQEETIDSSSEVVEEESEDILEPEILEPSDDLVSSESKAVVIDDAEVVEDAPDVEAETEPTMEEGEAKEPVTSSSAVDVTSTEPIQDEPIEASPVAEADKESPPEEKEADTKKLKVSNLQMDDTPKKPKKSPKAVSAKKAVPMDDDDILDVLGLDD